MIFGIANDGHPTAILGNGIALRHRIWGVVSSLRLNVRVNLSDEGAYVELRENYDGIDIGKSDFLGAS